MYLIFFLFQDAQGSAKKRPALPEDHFDFDDPENGPSPSKRRMHDEVIFILLHSGAKCLVPFGLYGVKWP